MVEDEQCGGSDPHTHTHRVLHGHGRLYGWSTERCLLCRASRRWSIPSGSAASSHTNAISSPPPLPLSLFCCCCRFFSASSFLSLAPAGHADNASLQKRKKGEKERRKRNRDGPGHLMYGFGPIAQWLAQPKMIPRRGKRKLESWGWGNNLKMTWGDWFCIFYIIVDYAAISYFLLSVGLSVIFMNGLLLLPVCTSCGSRQPNLHFPTAHYSVDSKCQACITIPAFHPQEPLLLRLSDTLRLLWKGNSLGVKPAEIHTDAGGKKMQFHLFG